LTVSSKQKKGMEMNVKTFEEFISDNSNGVMPDTKDLVNNFKKEFDLDVTCLPCDDPIAGEVGYVIFRRKNNIENTVFVSRSIGPKVTTKKLPSKDMFKSVYNSAIAYDLPIERYDDPSRLMVGFIVSRGSGRTWYCLPISKLREPV